MKVRFGLRMKVTLLFMGFMLLFAFAIYILVEKNYTAIFQEQQRDYAETVAQLVETMVSKEELHKYVQTKEEDADYREMIAEMKELQKRSGFYYLYIVYLETEEKGIYVFDLRYDGDRIVIQHKLGKSNDLKKNYPGLPEALQAGEAGKHFDQTTDGELVLDSVYVPMYDDSGWASAFVGVDYSDDAMKQQIREILKKIFLILFTIMGACFLLLLVIIRLSILQPVYRLAEQAKQVSEGNFSAELQIRGRDELSEIRKVFNRMSASIAGNMEEMRTLNEAYYRYVPSRILTLLGKESICDIALGDETNARLSVMSIQMADFERNIRKKNTREMLYAINQILRVSVSVVSEQAGMIESIQNAGFTALFEGNCEAALAGAVTICQRLHQMEQTGQIDKNRIGIGIAYGDVTLGIVGQEKRMAAITVSQYRDVACFLQEIAERYQSHILLTQETADHIREFSSVYHSRFLGFLYNPYTGYSSRIYDVYDGDGRQEIVWKDATREVFEQGVEYYCLGEFAKARQSFIAVLKNFRKDRAAKEYLYLCDQKCMQTEREENDIYFIRME